MRLEIPRKIQLEMTVQKNTLEMTER